MFWFRYRYGSPNDAENTVWAWMAIIVLGMMLFPVAMLLIDFFKGILY